LLKLHTDLWLFGLRTEVKCVQTRILKRVEEWYICALTTLGI